MPSFFNVDIQIYVNFILIDFRESPIAKEGKEFYEILRCFEEILEFKTWNMVEMQDSYNE